MTKFDKETLREYLVSLTDDCLVFWRENSEMQERIVDKENYIWDFIEVAEEKEGE